MSSHHFVKEQQEPALVILDTSGITFDHIAPLLEWVPTVLVSQNEVYTVISWGIKIDLILAEMEFQKSHFQLLEEQYPVKFLGVIDSQFLEEALQYLIATKHSAANIIGFNHLKVHDLEPKLEFLDLVVWDGAVRYFPVKNGKFKKWFTMCTIQLHAPENTLIEMRNAAGSKLIHIIHSTMVDVPEGVSEFHANDIFWIGEFFD
ncbi:thiamine pyrophosphokinase [Cyclobacteriaceae bacterium YHN15]|nr:thiamine pyrophosphokinase [Cyclobacteriaceae bacterium YHN15]